MNLLYIEDRDDFRLDISYLLNNFFKNIYVAKDEKESIKLYKKNHPQIVIMDIDMHVYYFDWVKTAKHIKKINPDVKIIVLSLHDKKELFLNAIDIGVTKFLIKPVEHFEISNALELAIDQLEYEHHKKIFHTYLHSIFNYRKTMIMMVKDKKPILVNYIFLDFFDLESIHEFNEKYDDLGDLFLEHNGYLYNKPRENWLDIASDNYKKQYNVKIKNKDGLIKHFLFKYYPIAEEDSYAILSFDDITELDVDKDLDNMIIADDINIDDKNSLLKSLLLIQKNDIKVQLYNYYKGLTIVHDAVIVDVKENSLVLQTDYLQQKAVQIEGKTLISSEILPYTIACNKVSKISFENRNIELEDIHYTSTSPATRKTIRLSPDSKSNVHLFVNDKKVVSNIKISDISFDSVQLTFDNVPTNLYKGDKVVIDMILSYKNRPFTMNTKATVVKEAKRKRNDSISFAFDLDEKKKDTMVKYIAARQVEIIQEFKALKNKAH